MIQRKTDWVDTDFVNVEDYNRIMTRFSNFSAGVYGQFVPVDESYVFTEDSIYELRSRYEITAEALGCLQRFPQGMDYSEFDPLDWLAGNIFPALAWRCTWGGDHNFPPAWELNLYERLCQYADECEYMWHRCGDLYCGEV